MISNGYIEAIAKQLMMNLDQKGTSSAFEIDSEYMAMILKQIFDSCPFEMGHINFNSIEYLIESSISEGERMECEIWVGDDTLYLSLQSEVGRVEY